MNEPNNLLGRLALEKMWPMQYKALRDVTTEVPVIASSAKVVGSSKVDESQHVQLHRTPQTLLKKPHAQPDPGKKQNKYPVTPVVPSTVPALPEMRVLPPLPEGEITKDMGKARCKLICDIYPEVFNEDKGEFLGAEATMLVKEGHMEKLLQVGVRPPAKIPYGLEDQYNSKLDELLEDCVPVDGQDIIVASQVVPVCEMKDGKKVIKRLAINYKSTINDHL